MPFTQDAELELSFDAKLIPATLNERLAQHNLHIRPLASSDYHRGHIHVLASLTSVQDPGEDRWKERFNELAQSTTSASKYFVVVIVSKHSDKLVATGTVFLEPKFLRNLASAAHIEDIAVDHTMQGKGLGKVLIQALTTLSEAQGAYKTLLDCNDDNVPFYNKCGYETKGVYMAKYK
ncbi:glucosamine-phosphate N-acetyltransferase [Malassezia psittaci]|uniref:Glucosamine 6-phosphate N-acetyltransferase n=1 Tax=Malassezia psittaci TaxID=1821823 RepID=A0AAF0JEV2_9BASI|nr:glucosamine-phosphate N-acetyltransferase [Malassezia psittaci]